MAHLPLLEVRVKPEPVTDVNDEFLLTASYVQHRYQRKENYSPLAVAVKVAQVPDTYQVPALMTHPFCVPPCTTFR